MPFLRPILHRLLVLLVLLLDVPAVDLHAQAIAFEDTVRTLPADQPPSTAWVKAIATRARPSRAADTYRRVLALDPEHALAQAQLRTIGAED